MLASNGNPEITPENVEFKTSDSLTLRGIYYPGSSPLSKKPTIVVSPGFSCVKEMSLPNLASAFAAEGFNVLLYDNRNLGASDCQVPGEISPSVQIEDWKDAITYACTRGDVDSGRIGISGFSMGGGHAIVVAAQDARVKCVVAQSPTISGYLTWGALPEELRKQVTLGFAADRLSRFHGNPPAMLPVTSTDPAVLSVLPTPDAAEFFLGFAKENPGTSWRNAVTLRSVELARAYNPSASMPNISVPFLLILAQHDVFNPLPASLKAFDTAREPKKCVQMDCGHFDVLQGGWLEENVREQSGWFGRYL